MAVPVPSDLTTEPITDRIPIQRVGEPAVGVAPFFPMPPPPPPRRGRGALAVAAVFGLLAGVGGTVAAYTIRDRAGADRAAISSPASAAPATPTGPIPFTIRASLTLSATSRYGTGISTSGGTCEGTGGYADIQTGTGVTVTDAGGDVVATGYLGPGRGTASTCTFSLSVAPVSGESQFYSIEVSHRGKVTFPQSQLRTGSAMLSLGND